MITYTEAREILQAHARSFGREKLPLERAFGRVVAESIASDRDYPPFNRAAMDGYAFAYDDFEKGIREFAIAETLYAGQAATRALESGQCFRIMTGAATPAGANVIVRREDATEQAGRVIIHLHAVQPFLHIARRGEDLVRGQVVSDKPIVASPAVISLLAALGKPDVEVALPPQVALITTGNEVVPVNASVSPVQIRNSNEWMLKAMLARHHMPLAFHEHVPDDPQRLQQAFRKGLACDLVIACGGVSAGDADYVPGVMEALGVRKLFHKVQIRPGKPLWCGEAPGGTLVFALPGNPLSCMVTFLLFVKYYLHACYGLPAPVSIQMKLNQERRKKNNLDEFFPVRILPGSDAIEPVAFNGSGDIRAALFADGIALHSREKEVLERGGLVSCFAL